jgi:hypothetical protein
MAAVNYHATGQNDTGVVTLAQPNVLRFDTVLCEL